MCGSNAPSHAEVMRLMSMPDMIVDCTHADTHALGGELALTEPGPHGAKQLLLAAVSWSRRRSTRHLALMYVGRWFTRHVQPDPAPACAWSLGRSAPVHRPAFGMLYQYPPKYESMLRLFLGSQKWCKTGSLPTLTLARWHGGAHCDGLMALHCTGT